MATNDEILTAVNALTDEVHTHIGMDREYRDANEKRVGGLESCVYGNGHMGLKDRSTWLTVAVVGLGVAVGWLLQSALRIL